MLITVRIFFTFTLISAIKNQTGGQATVIISINSLSVSQMGNFLALGNGVRPSATRSVHHQLRANIFLSGPTSYRDFDKQF